MLYELALPSLLQVGRLPGRPLTGGEERGEGSERIIYIPAYCLKPSVPGGNVTLFRR